MRKLIGQQIMRFGAWLAGASYVSGCNLRINGVATIYAAPTKSVTIKTEAGSYVFQ